MQIETIPHDENQEKMVIGMKWAAYVNAYFDGTRYYYNYLFTIPEDLEEKIREACAYNTPLNKTNFYDELVKYAKIALDLPKLGNFDYKIPKRDKEMAEREKDDRITDAEYGECIFYFNEQNKRVNENGYIEYLRVYDPTYRELFVDYCYEEDDPKNYGQTINYCVTNIDETYHWSVSYSNEGPESVSEVSVELLDKEDTVFLDGDYSIFPDYEFIINAMKEGKTELDLA